MAATFRLTCPHCQKVCSVSPQLRGSTVACPHCRKTFSVPGSSKSPSPAFSPFRLDIGSATNRGQVRPRNEDCFLVQHLTWSDLDICRETALVIVTDGLGGHQAGDQAARLVIRTVGGAINGLLASALGRQLRDTSLDNLNEQILQAIKQANQTVLQKAKTDPALKGMAATVAVVLVWNGRVIIGHVGDCRVYLFRQDRLEQVTKDQTIVARMLELGQLTPEEAQDHPARHEITQAVGMRSGLDPAPYNLWLKQGDCLIVASDGLNAHVDERMIATAIRKTGYSASILAHHLVELANKGGGEDNITVAAINCY